MSKKIKMIVVALFAMMSVSMFAQSIRIDKLEVRGQEIKAIDGVYNLVWLTENDTCKLTVSNVGNEPKELRIQVSTGPMRTCGKTRMIIQPKDKSVIAFGTYLWYQWRNTNPIKRSIIINYDGTKTKVDVKYSVLSSDRNLIFLKRNTKFGAVDINERDIIPFEYDGLEYCYFDNKIIKAKKNGKLGLIDEKNAILIPFDYDDILDFKNGLAHVKINDDEYVVNVNKTVVYELRKRFDEVCFGYDNVVEYVNEGKYGYLDAYYQVIIPAEYTGAHKYEKSGAVVQKNGKWGVVDKNNKIIIPFEYEDLSTFINNGVEIKAKKNGKWGKIDMDNKIVTPFIYDRIIDVF